MNKQQQAQMHKCEYKTRARMRKFNKRYGDKRGAVVIDLPDATDTPWLTNPEMSLRDRALIIEEADRLTNGNFSKVMAGQPRHEGQPSFHQFRKGMNSPQSVKIIDPLDPPFPQRDYLFYMTQPELQASPELTKKWHDSFPTTPQQESNEE